MIPYVNRSFGLETLKRAHGSALYKSLLPALISTAIYLYIAFNTDATVMEELFIHPYPMQALVTAFTFLLVFRANYSYNRWWEAYTAVYLMHSKWLDLATEIAAFHYQSKRYDHFKPPSFGANPGVQNLDFNLHNYWEASAKNDVNINDQDELLHNSNSSTGNSAPRFGTSSTIEEGNVLTPPHSPRKQSQISRPSPLKVTPNPRTRHAKQTTLTDLIEQMDAREAEEEQMKRQSLISEGSNEDEDDDGDIDDNAVSGAEGSLDQIDSGLGGGETPGEKKKSWLRKIRDRRSQSRSDRKLKKVEKHRRLTNAISVHFDAVPINSRESGNVNASRNHPTGKLGKQKLKRRRSRHQPATAALYNQRKTIARTKESLPHEDQLEFRDRFDVKTGKAYSTFTAFSRKHLREGNLDPDDVPPMLFLEECAHLLSLMSAVAFSTLRNDLPEAESPLTSFIPGLPLPLVDPDGYKSKVRTRWTSKSRFYSVLHFGLDLSRNDQARTLYNASRPFRVIGNVSDAEIEKLQEARGPLAKVSLISMWLLELISREYQAGSTGEVAAPILSRLYQFVSEGLAGYNQARKIAYIPFPFPHAQITTLYLFVVDFLVTPLLMTTFVTDITLGFFLNLFSVVCFTGLHEVAREIENPFQNVPNDVPLNNYQAQFNEGLMVMFYGYHPDAFWNDNQSDRFKNSSPNARSEFNSPNTDTSAKSDRDYKTTVKFPDINLPPLKKQPANFSTDAKGRESWFNTTTNSREVKRTFESTVSTQPIVNLPTDDFLRGVVASTFGASSTTDSFQKVRTESDSFRMSSDNSAGPSSNPVAFRIPKRTTNEGLGIQLQSDESNASPVIPREDVLEEKE